MFQDRGAITSREDILTSLSSLDFDKKQKHVFSQRREGTGQWLLQCPEFEGWFKGVTCQTLWCYGIRKSLRKLWSTGEVRLIEIALTLNF